MKMVEGHKMKQYETNEEIEARLEAEENHKQLFLNEIQDILENTIKPKLADISYWEKNDYENQIHFKTSDGVEYKVGLAFYSEEMDKSFGTFNQLSDDAWYFEYPDGSGLTQDIITVTAEVNEFCMCFTVDVSIPYDHS